jgi:hypothetical protein
MRSCVRRCGVLGPSAATGVATIGWGVVPVKRETDNAQDSRGTTGTFHAAPEQP